LVETVRAQGVEVTAIPTHPVSFSTLVGDLESLGLLSNTEPDLQPAQVKADDHLVQAHKAQIQEHLAGESRSDVNPPMPPPPTDILGPLITGSLGEVINIEGLEIVVDTTNTDDVAGTDTSTPQAPRPPLIPNDQVPDLLPPGGSAPAVQQQLQPVPDCLDQSCAILRADNAQLRETVKTQEAELSRMREKCLQLENHSSTDRGLLISELREMFTATMNTGFQALELGFSDKVATEMRFEITRGNEDIMEQLHALPVVKSLAEATHTDLASLSDSVTDIARAVGSSRTQILPLLQQLTSGAPSQVQHDLLSEIRTKVSANSGLLTEALKANTSDRSGFETPSKTPNSEPLTPVTHTKPKKCYECGSVGHNRQDCPDKLAFCARCMSKAHKTYACPSIRSICPVCKSAGLGELAYGHTKAVHLETNREKREKITQFTAKICFPQWADQDRKRKSPPV